MEKARLELAAAEKRTKTSSWAPRGLSREHAAAYLDISPGTFDTLVRAGKLPKPRQFIVTAGCRPMLRWDRYELDQAFEELGSVGPNPWDNIDGH